VLNKNQIIIKRIKKNSAQVHHTGMWKIAYADFVTAMMAFFLLMWLINTVSEEHKKGIADYFSPPSIISLQSQNGSQGVISGQGPSGDQTNNNDEPLGGMTENSENSEVFGNNTESNHEKNHKSDNDSQKNKDSDKPLNNPGLTNEQKKGESQENRDRNRDISSQLIPNSNDGSLSQEQEKKNLMIQKEANRVVLHLLEETQKSGANVQSESVNESMPGKPKQEQQQNLDKSQDKKEDQKELKKEDQKENAKPVKIKSNKNYLENVEATVLNDKQKDEQTQFKDLADALLTSIKKNPELKGVSDQVVFEIRPDGIRIELLDSAKISMFPSGSSQANQATKKIISKITDLVQEMQNKIIISGHTDAYPDNTRGYSNWELSADRANKVRRFMTEKGVTPERFESVTGEENTDPYNKLDPYAPENRRISITILRDQPLNLDQLKKLQQAG